MYGMPKPRMDPGCLSTWPDKQGLFDRCKNRAVFADVAVGVIVFAGSAACLYLIFRFGWPALLRTGAVGRLSDQRRYALVILLGLAIGATSVIPFIEGSYWLALGLFVGGVALAVATNLLRFRAAEHH